MANNNDHNNVGYDPLGTEAILIHEAEADFLWELWDGLSVVVRGALLDRLWANVERCFAALEDLLESGD